MNLLYLIFLLSTTTNATTCESWFLKSGVKAGTKDCNLECATIPVDMGTFDCANQCEKFCKTYVNPDSLDKIALYVEIRALTPAERSLIAKYPIDAVKAYLAKNDALESTRRIFGANFRNDESDAYRHFMWSGLMREKIGAELTLAFLKAHEADLGNPNDEQKMDLENNDLGVNAAERLLNQNKFNQQALERAALTGLEKKLLKVISPTGKVPEWKR